MRVSGRITENEGEIVDIISRIFNKSAQISLVREEQVFYLLAYYDETLSPIDAVAEKWIELKELEALAGDQKALRNKVPISRFTKIYSCICRLKDQCAGNKKISVYIPAEIEEVQILPSAPDWFAVSYLRRENELVRTLPENVIELEDGWLCHQNTYWKYERLNADEVLSFRKASIPIEEWVNFAKNDLPVYRAAGMNINSCIEYNNCPALKLEIQKYAEETAEIRVTWEIEPETIDESVCLEEHVLSMNRVLPGLRPSVVKEVFPEQLNVLSSLQLASFLDRKYTAWEKWFSAIPSEFEKIHSWIEPPYTWKLVARSKLIRGVGKAYAYPIACIGENKLSLEELKMAMRNPYARLHGGWVRKDDLLTLGMNEDGYRPDGTEVKPVRLNAALLLHNGGSKLGSFWSAMERDGAEWVASGGKHICAGKHLRYLLHWGINGGLACGYGGMTAYGIPLLSWISKTERNCKILLLGSKEDIRELRDDYLYLESLLKEQDFKWYDYETAFHNEGLKRKRWDLLLLIEPDVYTSEQEKMFIRTMAATSASCKIGFFAKPLQNDREMQRWAASLLGYGTEIALMDLLVRNHRKPKPLPERYVFQPQKIEKVQPVFKRKSEATIIRPMDDGGVEIILRGEEAPGSSVPVRIESKPVLENIKKNEEPSSKKKTTAKIILDVEKLNRLRSDSDEVREALIASVSGQNMEENIVVEVERPEGTENNWNVEQESLDEE